MSIMLLFFKAWEGVGVVSLARKLIGSTNPLQADPGII
jgi:nucleoside-diphosphate kinase